MNKKRNIIIGSLALIITMMVGYAIFSDTITINGTATAKGDFGITAECEFVTEDYAFEDGLAVEGSTGKGSCNVSGKTVTTNSTYSKPTENNTYKVTLKNTGSIPAVLKTVDSSNNFDIEMKNTGDVFYIDKQNSLMAYYVVIKDGVQIDAAGDQMVEQAKITLQPNETITLLIIEGWMNSEDLRLETQPVIPDEGVKMNYNITFGFEQVTN